MSSEQGYDAMPVTADQVAEVFKLAAKLTAAELEVEKCETALKQAKELATQLATKEVPERMLKMGLRELTLPGGNVLEVEDKLSASISKERAAEAHSWLDANKHGGMIKRVVSVAFGRDETEKAKALVAQLSAVPGFSVKVEEWVEPPTLKAFCREQVVDLGNGEFPRELFGVHRFDQAKIKDPKKPKGKKKESVFGE